MQNCKNRHQSKTGQSKVLVKRPPAFKPKKIRFALIRLTRRILIQSKISRFRNNIIEEFENTGD